MTGKKALKRIRQETAPATYMQDFNKKECCDVIEKELDVLQILKQFIKVDRGVANLPFVKLNIGTGCELISEEEYNKIKEWLENEEE